MKSDGPTDIETEIRDSMRWQRWSIYTGPQSVGGQCLRAFDCVTCGRIRFVSATIWILQVPVDRVIYIGKIIRRTFPNDG